MAFTEMPAHQHPLARQDIVARLRAAGSVFAEDEADLLVSSAGSARDLADMVDRRVSGLPLEHILGWAEFCGLRIAVDPGVFVPRRRTEFLAQQAVALCRPDAVVVDLCCGSGAVGAALLTAVPGAELYATDIDPAAVRCARRNLPVPGRLFCGDLYQPLPETLRGRVDVLVANAPYVPTGAIELMPAEARVNEARVALDGGEDGLDVQRRVAAGAPSWLARRGSLLVETSTRQAPETARILAANGMVPRVETCEERGATVVVGSLPE
jgi:release factor glutamine methyltransferase